MGITLGKLVDLRDRGILRRGCRLLDIGSSNLYSADEDGLTEFVTSFGAKPDRQAIKRLAAGSYYGPNGGTNESFVGELIEMAGMSYAAFDVAVGYKTVIFDLNTETLPLRLHGTFDVVVNFGTTEHVINQLNSFRVMHDAVRVGGHMVHELPSSGWVDHGYFTYTPRFLFDIAGHNKYAIERFIYNQPERGKNIFGIVRDYTSYFPALNDTLEEQKGIADTFALDISMLIIMRKTQGGKFRNPSELSTAVVKKGAMALSLGDLPGSVASSVISRAQNFARRAISRSLRQPNR